MNIRTTSGLNPGLWKQTFFHWSSYSAMELFYARPPTICFVHYPFSSEWSIYYIYGVEFFHRAVCGDVCVCVCVCAQLVPWLGLGLHGGYTLFTCLSHLHGEMKRRHLVNGTSMINLNYSSAPSFICVHPCSNASSFAHLRLSPV